jgi:predicted metal-dependent peptidase
MSFDHSGAVGEELAAARLWAVNEAPYLATALFASVPILVPGLGTMASDRHWRMYIDPELAERWTVEQLGAVMIHEAHHMLRDHGGRAHALGVSSEIERLRFNVAADMEINDDLESLPLPDGGVYPKTFSMATGRLAEEYDALLKAHGTDLPNVNCGAGAHGVRQEWELERSGSEPGVDEWEADLIRKQVAEAVRISRQAGGHVPAGFERWAKAFLRPQIDWRREFAAQVRAGLDAVSGAVDYSYRKPSRRAASPIGRAVVLPALVQPVPRVAVVVDTSASMSAEHLERVLAEVKGLLRSRGIRGSRLSILSCDTAIRSSQEVFAVEQVRLHGGGGTDMGAGLQAAAALRPRPEVIVVLTDGQTPWPNDRPPAQVVVALIGGGAANPPPWARTVRINTSEAPDSRYLSAISAP